MGGDGDTGTRRRRLGVTAMAVGLVATGLGPSVLLSTASSRELGGTTLATPQVAAACVPGAAPCTTAACTPGATCTATPPTGVDNAYTVQATGGTSPAVLEAELNGGLEPECARYRERSADWVRFGFTDPTDGETWTKTITLTGVHPLTRKQARKELRKAQICYAAPYRFYPRPGFKVTGPTAGGDYQGVLPECGTLHNHHTPRHATPCVVERTLVAAGGGWVLRLGFRVPAGEQDPRGKS